jgi:signal transduction histidine kinase
MTPEPEPSSLESELRTVPPLADLPDEIIRWLAAHMVARDLAAGEVLVEAGSPADRMLVTFIGDFQGTRPDGGPPFRFDAGQVTGMLPYSRLKTFPGTVRAIVPSRVATLSTAFFPEMLERFPVLGQRLVGLMSDRIRENTRAAEQREKLMSLGKLSAGLAHELNNPSSAARRAAEGLREAVARLRDANARLDQHSLTAPQRAELAAREQQCLASASSPAPADPLERSDREQALGDWLDRRGVPEGWTVAAGLADAGLDLPRVEAIAAGFPSEALGDVLARLSSSLFIARLVEEIESSTSRISELVKAIKEYSYMDQGPVQEVDLHQGLDSTLLIMKHRLKHGVTVFREYDRALPKICARPGELNQVWTNLIANAIDAMSGQGELRIRTARELDCVRVEIIDNGTGIEPEIQGRVFDPFFTTKGVGEGTGLGLDIVHRIVRDHHGDIRFESRPGATNFQVRLPINQPKGGSA